MDLTNILTVPLITLIILTQLTPLTTVFWCLILELCRILNAVYKFEPIQYILVWMLHFGHLWLRILFRFWILLAVGFVRAGLKVSFSIRKTVNLKSLWNPELRTYYSASALVWHHSLWSPLSVRSKGEASVYRGCCCFEETEMHCGHRQSPHCSFYTASYSHNWEKVFTSGVRRLRN